MLVVSEEPQRYDSSIERSLISLARSSVLLPSVPYYKTRKQVYGFTFRVKVGAISDEQNKMTITSSDSACDIIGSTTGGGY